MNGCTSMCLEESCADNDVMCKSRSVVCMGKCPAQCSVAAAQMVLESAANSDNQVASFVAQHVIASAQTAVQVEKILVDESKKLVAAQFGALQQVLNAGMESNDPILSQIASFINISLQTSVAQAQQLVNMIMGGQA